MAHLIVVATPARGRDLLFTHATRLDSTELVEVRRRNYKYSCHLGTVQHMPDASLIEVAWSAYEAGDLPRARRVVSDALARNSTDGEAHYLLGLIHLAQNDLTAAAESLRKAVESNPTDSEFQNNLGVVLRAQNNLDEAGRCFQRAVDLDGANAMAQFNLGLHHQTNGDLPAAEHHYTLAIDSDPNFVPAHVQLGEILAEQKRLGEAMPHWQKALALDPSCGVADLYMGHALAAAGRVDEAIASLQRAAAAGPRDPRPQWLLGNLLIGVGRVSDSAACYHHAVELDPRCVQAWEGLTHTLAAQKKFDEAFEAGRKALALTPNSATAYYALAVAFEKAGRMNEAKTCYRTAAKSGAASPALDYHIAALSQDPHAPTASPSEYLNALFGEYAATFEHHLVDVLKYRAPEQLLHAVQQVRGNDRTSLDILDLGCGTGRVGELFRPLARSIIGVDIVPQMVAKARARGVYDEVIQSDVAAYLSATDRTFDLILAGDVFIYIGDLSAIFPAAARILRSGGLFAFSLEAHNDPGFRLRASRRYTHNIEYARELARASGLGERRAERVALRQEDGRDVAGWIMVLDK